MSSPVGVFQLGFRNWLGISLRFVQVFVMRKLRFYPAVCFLVFGSSLSWAADLEATFSEEPESWSSWSPRSEIAPEFAFDSEVGRTGEGSLRIAGRGGGSDFGSWKTVVESIEPGKLYRFEAWFRVEGVENADRSVIARLHWKSAQGRQVRPPDFVAGSERQGEWTRVEYVTDAPSDASELEIQLGLGFTASGAVWWDDVSLKRADSLDKRVVRVATVHHKARNKKSAQESLDVYLELLDRAASKRPDIICLPEGITTIGNPLSFVDVAESVPGPTTRQLGEAARRHGVYIVAGIYERAGDIVYNTAVLLNRQGELDGIYRKTHLPREEWEAGLSPGDTYPVFNTDFGKIGMLICWDIHFPEPARSMAAQGADLLLLPIWGGNDLLTRARAIENHVYLVSSSYSMRSFVVDPLGEVLSEAKDDDPIAVAEIDLDAQYFQDWLGNMKHRAWKERRPDIPVD